MIFECTATSSVCNIFLCLVFFSQAEPVEVSMLKYILRQAQYDNLKSISSM